MAPIHARPHPIDEHADWSLSIWHPSGLDPTLDPQVFDHAVMGMGLAGESLETLEAAMADGPLDAQLMLHELGDTLYYWCVSCSRAGLVPSSAWPRGLDFDSAPLAPLPRPDIDSSAIQLAIASGRCAEAFKKMVRDGAPPARLAAALPAMAERWAALARACGFSPSQVALANRAKLAGRALRGTLRGDGNDR